MYSFPNLAGKHSSMKKAILLFFLIFSLELNAQTFNSDSAFVRDHYTKLEKLIPMRDGKKLFTAIYIPKDKSKKYPFLINRTPYTCWPYGADTYKPTLGPSMLFAHAGYIFVYQDVRGKWMSEGSYEDVRPHIANKKGKKDVDESSDTYDTIDWLLKHVAGNNGKAGIYGISYPGFYSTAALPDAHPALKAASPQAPVTDWFMGDDAHHNGAFCLADMFSFHANFGVPRPHPITPDKGPKNFAYGTNDAYKFYLKLGALKNAKLKYFGDSIAFWNDAMKHPDYDAFWKARVITPHLKNIKPATLVVGGFFDAEDCYGTFATYQALEKQNQGNDNKLVVGPWFHGGWARASGDSFGDQRFGQETSTWYQEHLEFPFFEHHLKGAPAPELAEASIFITGSNEWRNFDKWPPAESMPEKLFLGERNILSFDAPEIENSFDEYTSDPNKPVPYAAGVQIRRTREYMIDDQRFAATRPDVMVYETSPLAEDMTLAGSLTADLWVSTSGTDADYVVKLIDVFPDDYPNNDPNPQNVQMGGYEMLVRGEVMRGRYRNSFEKPEAFIPGQITEVSFAMPDIAHTFRKGHRIMVQIQNTWFPIVDRNPQKFVNIYEAKDTDFQRATHRIYHDRTHPTSLTLPLLKK